MTLDHENLDVYRVSLDFAAWAYSLCREFAGLDRHARDQLLRASQSIALNIAEGCGKLSPPDRGRYFQIASGSARECSAVLDILVRCRVLGSDRAQAGKDMLVRVVAMLVRMVDRLNAVREGDFVYGDANGNGDVAQATRSRPADGDYR